MTEEDKKKLEELYQKKADLEKALAEETNGQKKGGITRSLNSVKKEIEVLEYSGSDNESGDSGSADADQDNRGADTESGKSEEEEDDERVSSEENLISVTVQSKTGQKYRRLGLVFTKNVVPFKVTAEQLEALKKDPWLKVVEPEARETAE